MSRTVRILLIELGVFVASIVGGWAGIWFGGGWGGALEGFLIVEICYHAWFLVQLLRTKGNV